MFHETHAGAAVGSQEQDGMWNVDAVATVSCACSASASFFSHPETSLLWSFRPQARNAGCRCPQEWASRSSLGPCLPYSSCIRYRPLTPRPGVGRLQHSNEAPRNRFLQPCVGGGHEGRGRAGLAGPWSPLDGRGPVLGHTLSHWGVCGCLSRQVSSAFLGSGVWCLSSFWSVLPHHRCCGALSVALPPPCDSVFGGSCAGESVAPAPSNTESLWSRHRGWILFLSSEWLWSLASGRQGFCLSCSSCALLGLPYFCGFHRVYSGSPALGWPCRLSSPCIQEWCSSQFSTSQVKAGSPRSFKT